MQNLLNSYKSPVASNCSIISFWGSPNLRTHSEFYRSYFHTTIQKTEDRMQGSFCLAIKPLKQDTE